MGCLIKWCLIKGRWRCDLLLLFLGVNVLTLAHFFGIHFELIWGENICEKSWLVSYGLDQVLGAHGVDSLSAVDGSREVLNTG